MAALTTRTLVARFLSLPTRRRLQPPSSRRRLEVAALEGRELPGSLLSDAISPADRLAWLIGVEAFLAATSATVTPPETTPVAPPETPPAETQAWSEVLDAAWWAAPADPPAGTGIENGPLLPPDDWDDPSGAGTGASQPPPSSPSTPPPSDGSGTGGQTTSSGPPPASPPPPAPPPPGDPNSQPPASTPPPTGNPPPPVTEPGPAPRVVSLSTDDILAASVNPNPAGVATGRLGTDLDANRTETGSYTRRYTQWGTSGEGLREYTVKVEGTFSVADGSLSEQVSVTARTTNYVDGTAGPTDTDYASLTSTSAKFNLWGLANINGPLTGYDLRAKPAPAGGWLSVDWEDSLEFSSSGSVKETVTGADGTTTVRTAFTFRSAEEYSVGSGRGDWTAAVDGVNRQTIHLVSTGTYKTSEIRSSLPLSDWNTVGAYFAAETPDDPRTRANIYWDETNREGTSQADLTVTRDRQDGALVKETLNGTTKFQGTGYDWLGYRNLTTVTGGRSRTDVRLDTTDEFSGETTYAVTDTNALTGTITTKGTEKTTHRTDWTGLWAEARLTDLTTATDWSSANQTGDDGSRTTVTMKYSGGLRTAAESSATRWDQTTLTRRRGGTITYMADGDQGGVLTFRKGKLEYGSNLTRTADDESTLTIDLLAGTSRSVVETAQRGTEGSWARDVGEFSVRSTRKETYDLQSTRRGRFNIHNLADLTFSGDDVRSGTVSNDAQAWGKETTDNQVKTVGLTDGWTELKIPTTQTVKADGSYQERQVGEVRWGDGTTQGGTMEVREKHTGHETVTVTEKGTQPLVRDGSVERDNVSVRDGDYSDTSAQRTVYAANGQTIGSLVTEAKATGTFQNTVKEASRENYVGESGYKEINSNYTLNGEYATSDKITRGYVNGEESLAAARRVIGTTDKSTLLADYGATEVSRVGTPLVEMTTVVKSVGRQLTDDRVVSTYAGVGTGSGWREIGREAHTYRRLGAEPGAPWVGTQPPAGTVVNSVTRTVVTPGFVAGSSSRLETKAETNIFRMEERFDGTARDHTASVVGGALTFLNSKQTDTTTAPDVTMTGVTETYANHTIDLDDRETVAAGVRRADQLSHRRTYGTNTTTTWTYNYPDNSKRVEERFSKVSGASNETGTFASSRETVSVGGDRWWKTTRIAPDGTRTVETVEPSQPWSLGGIDPDTNKVIYRENGRVVREEVPAAWTRAEAGYTPAWDYVRVVGGALEVVFGAGMALTSGGVGTGFGVLIMGMGIDNIITGVANIRTGRPMPSLWDFGWKAMTGSDLAGPAVGMVLSFGMGRIWQLGRVGRYGAAMERGAGRLFVAERVSGETSDLPGLTTRIRYRREYQDIIQALKGAGRRGITLEQLMVLDPELQTLLGGRNAVEALNAGGAFANRFWETLGRVSGAVSNPWLTVREVGAWVVLREGTLGTSVIINMGSRAYFPRLAALFYGEESRRIPRFMRPRLPEPRENVIRHFGHTHPTQGGLTLSDEDQNMLRILFAQYPQLVPPYRQAEWMVIVGPTGQWRRVNYRVPGTRL